MVELSPKEVQKPSEERMRRQGKPTVDVGGKENLSAARLLREIRGDISVQYDRREQEIGEQAMRELERRVMLSVIDRRWREHLYEMDYLKEGIGIRAMAQRDPVVEYAREGFLMYNDMVFGIKEDVIGYLFNLHVQVQPASGVQIPSRVSELLQAAVKVAQPGDSQEATADDDAGAPMEERVEIQAKGLRDTPKAEELSYSSAEGEFQQGRPPSRAERRKREREARRQTKHHR